MVDIWEWIQDSNIIQIYKDISEPLKGIKINSKKLNMIRQ